MAPVCPSPTLQTTHPCCMLSSVPPPQVFILDSVVNYTPADAKDAEAVVERVLPRLQVGWGAGIADV